MIPSVIEKFSFGIAAVVLFLQNRLAMPLFAAGLIDLIFGLLFIAAFLETEPYSSD